MKSLKQRRWNMVWAGCLLLITIFVLEDCDSGGGSGNEGGNSCAVPSLMTNWEDTYYHYATKVNGDPLLAMSDGQTVIAGGIYHDEQGSPFPMALTGPVVDEAAGDLIDGAVDWNWDGAIEAEENLSVVEGTLTISGYTLELSGLIIDGDPVEDMTGTCEESGSATPQLASVVTEIAALYDGLVDSPEPFACSGPGWDTDADRAVYEFRDPIRIGDDDNYNADHSPDFKISSPSGKSYSESFEVPGDCYFSKAEIQYTIAGANEAAKVYLNGSLVGRTCNPGNTATAIKRCDDIDITGKLRSGSNTLKVSTVLYPGDEVDPYDDIEIYGLRISLYR